MATTDPTRVSAGVPAGGQYTERSHGEPSVSLQPGTDPHQQVDGIYAALRSQHSDMTTSVAKELLAIYRKHGADAALEEAKTYSHGGRCKFHADRSASALGWCIECKIAYAVDAWTNPAPTPTPYGVQPGPEKQHRLTTFDTSVEDDEESSVRYETSGMSGDEKFEAAVRNLFSSPGAAPVTVFLKQETDYSQYTEEHTEEVEVQCGDATATFSDLGHLMTELDRAERPSAESMALRFMRAVSAERPLLQGVAAVYLAKGYGAPEPVFGQVLQVFSGGRQQIHLLHTDGRSEYISMSRIAAILETDQSSIYEEPAEEQP